MSPSITPAGLLIVKSVPLLFPPVVPLTYSIAGAGLGETDGLIDTDGETDGLIEGLTLTDGETETEGDTEGEIDTDGLTDGEIETLGLTEGLIDGLRDGDTETLGETDGLTDTEGEVEADGDTEGEAEALGETLPVLNALHLKLPGLVSDWRANAARNGSTVEGLIGLAIEALLVQLVPSEEVSQNVVPPDSLILQ